MNGRERLALELLVEPLGVIEALVGVAVDGAHIAEIVGLAVRRRQRRSGGGGADIGDALLPQDRRGRRRGA